ncbi:MAG: hypothetical protein HY725_06655 [Candidatus Rokubacteria bacterium]|nr:hypothetical protein [Candidatus Rokubacteria bacterium]
MIPAIYARKSTEPTILGVALLAVVLAVVPGAQGEPAGPAWTSTSRHAAPPGVDRKEVADSPLVHQLTTHRQVLQFTAPSGHFAGN